MNPRRTKQIIKTGSHATEDGYCFSKNGLWSYVWILLFFIITFKLHISGDTVALVHGLDSALQCFYTNPIRWPCGPQVVHFPIFQYLIALPFLLLGFEEKVLLLFLAMLNVGWFIVSIATFWRAGNLAAGIRGGHLALLVLFSGYITWYATSSFNESAAFALFALLALSVLEQWKIFWIATIAFFCTITKEIAAPFVFCTIVIAALTRDQEFPNFFILYKWIYNFTLQYLYAFITIILGVTVNLLFNLFRFGSIYNIPNLNPLLHTPWIYVPEFFSLLWFSPAGGLFFVWGTLCLLIIVGFYFCRYDQARVWLILLTIGIIVLVNIGLAKWFSPFGWYAWGPRLTLPFLGGAGVILIVLTSADIIHTLTVIKNKIIIISIGLCIFILAIPNIAVRVDERQLFVKMFSPTFLQKNYGFNNFTIQLVPKTLYMEASVEIYSRNILIPTAAKIVSENILIFIIWFIYLMSTLSIIYSDNSERNAKCIRHYKKPNGIE